ncbi:hypothetical protein [Streptomyces echinatus]|nr:hypothetical protein [Streptomyces echinatus]
MPPPPYPNQPQPPYGQQPPQAPGPYGSPYPQQQPYPAQQHPPQAPYPPQPYPGWGGPPMAPAPKKRRIGLVLGIVGGVVAAVVALLIVVGVVAESGFPEAENKLTLPQKLVDGRFELAQDLTSAQGRKIEDEAEGAWDAKDVVGVVGQYAVGGDNTKGVLVLSGMYGRFKNTDTARRNMLKGAAEADGVTLAVPRKDFTQDGEPTVSCEVLTQKSAGATMTYPVCAWTDGNTGAAIASMTSETAKQDPSEVDLAFYAKLTRQIRSETLKPID